MKKTKLEKLAEVDELLQNPPSYPDWIPRGKTGVIFHTENGKEFTTQRNGQTLTMNEAEFKRAAHEAEKAGVIVFLIKVKDVPEPNKLTNKI